MSTPVPESVGRFEILGRLGSGGMGEVYAARDPALKRKVALKRLLPADEAEPETRQRLLHEARTAARIQHQHIAALHDVIDVDGDLWLVMEHVEGRTLRDETLPLPVERVLEIGLQCARALGAAHRQGVVHGDIKPANVMIDGAGDVKILDFGVAGMMAPVDEDEATMTMAWQRPGTVGLTMSYAAPEVLLNRGSDHRADIFSLGVLLYELLTGGNPFLAKGVPETTERVLHMTPPPVVQARPEAPAGLASLLEKMLAKDPRERHATTEDLVVDLETLRDRYRRGELGPEPLPSSVTATGLRAEAEAALGRRWAWFLGVAALAVLAVAISSAWWPREPADPSTRPREAALDLDSGTHVVAVLPATSLDDQDADIAALSRGLTSILTARLTQVSRSRNLQVLPSSLLREFAVTGLEAARREFGVTLAVQVDARRVGDEVRVTTNLVDVAGRRQIDADTLVGDMRNVIDLEERVALGAMRMLHLAQQPAGADVAAAGTSEPRAYAFYVQGRGYLADYTDPDAAESAVELFRTALEIDPGFAAAHAGLGEALLQRYRHTGDEQWIDRGLEECRTAVALDEDRAPPRVCLGRLYQATGQFEEAVDEFQRAVALDPTLDTALRGLAMAYEESGQLELAEVTYEQAIEARPGDWAHYNRLGGFYYRRGRYEEAAEAFRHVVEITPDSFRGFSNLGAAYWGLERWEDAKAAFERALEIHPEDQVTLSNLGTLAFFEGDYAAAARRFEQALAVDDEVYYLWGYLGDALHWGAAAGVDLGGDVDERAEQAYRRAIELGNDALEVNPRDAQMLREVALYHAMLGEAEPARRLVDRALAEGAADVDTQVWAAKVYAQLGEGERVLEHLRIALEAGYPRAEVRADPTFSGLSGSSEFQALVTER